MKKRILSMLLAITIVFTMLPLNAISSFAVACGDFYYELLEDNTVEITGYSGSESEVEIPATLDGYSVSSIRSEALDCDTIVNITVSSDNLNFVSEDGVLFNYDMTVLLQYPIGNTRTTYQIPDTVKTIDAYSFYYCDALEEIIIPESVTTIGATAFYNCTSLREVSIPSSVKNIGYNAFKGCLFSAINVAEDNSYYSSKDGVLFNKDATTLIQYPSGKTATLYSIPNTVTNIYSYAFFNCTSLTEIEIPESVTTIGDYAFSYCTNLKNVSFSDSVTSIGPNVLDECTAIETIYFGAGINTIDESFFNDCDALKEINVSENNANYSSENGVLFNKDKTELIRFPQNSPITDYEVSDGVTTINYNAFYECDMLIELTLPVSISKMGGYDGFASLGPFYGCESLTSLYFEGSADDWVKISFGSSYSNPMYYAENEYFNGMLALDVVLTESTTSINDYAFYGCDLTSITIPDSVTTIGYAFNNCSSLKDLYYEGSADDWTKINFDYSASNPMYYAKNEYFNGELVTDVVLSNGITSIGANTFYGCNSLSSITIPDSVTSIGSYAFYNCQSLKNMYYTGTADDWVKISFGSSESNPMRYAENEYFNGELVTDVVLSNGITSICDYAFYGCDSLSSITIPDSVTSIGSHAFYNCSSLKYVFYMGDETQWDGISFGNNNSPLTASFIHYNATGHTSTDWIVDSEPTCTTDGSKHRECTVCGEVETVKIDKSGHTSTDWIVDSEPTCTTDGSKHKECTVCGDICETETIPATGHIYGDFVITKQPTCTEEGAATKFCTVCGEELLGQQIVNSDLYPESNHNYSNNTNRTYNFVYENATSLELTFSSSTYVESGYDYIYIYDENGNLYEEYTGSSLAGETITLQGDSFSIKLTSDGSQTYYGFSFDSIVANMPQKSVDALGHDVEWVITVEPTCHASGLKEEKCVRCGEVHNSETIPKLTHNYVDNFCTLCNEPKITNKWLKDANGWYYIDSDGKKATNKWVKDSQGWCFVDANGYCLTNCWKADSVGWCYLDGNGRMVCDNWVKDNGKWYYLDSNGYMLSNTWLEKPEGMYYFNQSGCLVNEKAINNIGHVLANKLMNDSTVLLYNDVSAEEGFSGGFIYSYFTFNQPQAFLDNAVILDEFYYTVPYKIYEAEASKRFNYNCNLRSSEDYDVATDSMTLIYNGIGDSGPYTDILFYGYKIQGNQFVTYCYEVDPEYSYSYGDIAGVDYINVSGDSNRFYMASSGKLGICGIIKTVITFDGEVVKYYSSERINRMPSSSEITVLFDGTFKNGWYYENNAWYCYNDSIQMMDCMVGDYYLGSDGRMVTNQWVDYYECEYIYDESLGYYRDVYYPSASFYGADGKKVKNTWKARGSDWYYLNEYGSLTRNAWIKDSKGWCFLGSNGKMAKNQWVKDSKGWCYLGDNGYCVTNKWVKDSHGWCYLGSDGRMATNKWIKDSVGWCYVGSNGYCLTNSWVKDSKGWCYLDSNGRMLYNNWVKDNGKWYYLDSNGYMVTGTRVIDGKTYKFNSSGVWIG